MFKDEEWVCEWKAHWEEFLEETNVCSYWKRESSYDKYMDDPIESDEEEEVCDEEFFVRRSAREDDGHGSEERGGSEMESSPDSPVNGRLGLAAMRCARESMERTHLAFSPESDYDNVEGV